MRRPPVKREPTDGQGNRKVARLMGWQRQAESSELGDGGFPESRTIAKASGLDAPTRLISSLCISSTLRLPCAKGRNAARCADFAQIVRARIYPRVGLMYNE